LLKFCDKSFSKKKHLEAFRALFKKAGEVRKLQLEEELLNKYHLQSNRQLISILQKKQKKAIADFEKETGKKTKNEIDHTGEKVESYLKKIADKDLGKYNDYALKEINKLLKKQFTNDNVHEARIR